MPPSTPTPQPQHGIRWTRDALIGAVSLIAIAILILLGVQLSRGNEDYVCTVNVNDTQQGACTNGSWSPWTTTDGVSTRTYTGTVSTVSFAGTVSGVSCSHPSYSASQAVGQITTQYAACQIAETQQAASSGGTGTGTGQMSGTITSVQTVSATGGTSATSTGSFADYQNYLDTTLATSSISATPSIVRRGTTTVINWTSAYTSSCVVQGSNGDSWPIPETQTTYDADGNPVQTQVMPAALSGAENSSPIQDQTTYTLTCVSKGGRQLTPQQAIVNILPVYNVY
jgi:hypothetical protein